MSSNPLMMDYKGGDLLLAGAAVAGCWAAAWSLCMQTVHSDLKTAWQLSFSDGKCIRGVFHTTTRYIY